MLAYLVFNFYPYVSMYQLDYSLPKFKLVIWTNFHFVPCHKSALAGFDLTTHSSSLHGNERTVWRTPTQLTSAQYPKQ
jgi:hypothetical protein